MAFFENKEIKNRKAELSLRPDDPAAHFNLGVLYGTLNQGDKAILHILKAGNLFGEKNDPVNKMESRRLLKEFYRKFGFKPEDMTDS